MSNFWRKNVSEDQIKRVESAFKESEKTPQVILIEEYNIQICAFWVRVNWSKTDWSNLASDKNLKNQKPKAKNCFKPNFSSPGFAFGYPKVAQ